MPVQDSEEYFEGELKEWSDRKLTLLRNYLDPFVRITGSTHAGNVYYIDGFAGAGVYRDGAKGSPLRAAELAREFEQAGKQYRLNCINVEANPDIFENLQANTRSYANVTNLSGEFSHAIDSILNQVGRNPALFFIDPFGIRGIDWEAIQKIAGRRSPTDIWLRFDYQTVFRLAGFYGKELLQTARNMEILSKTYGINDLTFLHNCLQGADAQEKKRNAVTLYTSQLENAFHQSRGFGFSAAYLIRALAGQEKYFLVFATGHARGATLASETVCSIEETYEREVEEYKAATTPQLAFSLGLEPTEQEIFNSKVAGLKEAIWSACHGEINISRTDIYVRILRDWFGKLRSRHVNWALQELMKDGRIVAASGTPSDNNSRYTFRR